jgi:hypothetical protein
MCNGFGAIVDSELNVYFTKPDENLNIHHSIIINALGWRENTDKFIRNFVRIECKNWNINSFTFDEYGTLPAFAEEGEMEIKNKIQNILEKVDPYLEQYNEKLTELTNSFAPLYIKLHNSNSNRYKKAEIKYNTDCELIWLEYLENKLNVTDEKREELFTKLLSNLDKLQDKLQKKQEKIKKETDEKEKKLDEKMEALKEKFDLVAIISKLPGYVG